MKVGFNTLPLSSGHKARGMGVFTKCLLEELKLIQDIELQEFEEDNELSNVDLVHYPFFDLFQRSLPLRKKYPTVVTIPDITPLLFPEHYPPGIRGKTSLLWQKTALRNVAKIITISEASKKDIQKVLGVHSKKIMVTPLAANSEFKKVSDTKIQQSVQEKYNLPKRFILFVGNINWNKNLLIQTQAVLDAGEEIVLVGGGFENTFNLDHPEMRSYKEFLDKYSQNERVHILGYVSTEDLVAIYNLASIFLFATFYEGFGIPILEAQACGTPVITSNISSHPEVAGEAALYVDPKKTTEITEAIKKVMQDEKLRKKLIEQGYENANRFNWKKTALLTLQAYQDAIK